MTSELMLVLPAVAYFLMVWINADGIDFKGVALGLVKGHCLIFLFILVSTELLSIIGLLTPLGVLYCWILCLLFLCLLLRRKVRLCGGSISGIGMPWKYGVIVLLAGFVIIASVFMSGVLYPPNNWDSLCYHLPKVMHWASSGSISFFPTPDSRQNFMAPLAEYAILHIYLLSGSDRFFFLVQWVSLVAFGLNAYTMVYSLRGSHLSGLVALLVSLSLPMAILQGSSTQNDLVLASFVCAFATFMMRSVDRFKDGDFGWASVSMGLALMTKGSGYVYCAAIGLVWGGWSLWRLRHSYRKVLFRGLSLSGVVLIALLMNSSHYYRNIQTYGHPLSNEAEDIRNQEISIRACWDNAIRSILIQLGSPFPSVNRSLESVGHYLLGDRLEHPATTFPGIPFRVLGIRHEDFSSNPLHTVFAILFTVPCMALAIRKRQWTLVMFGLSWIAMGLMLSLMLRWQIWGSRLHIPIFGIMIPWFVCLLSVGSGHSRAAKKLIGWVGVSTVALCWVYALPFAFGNGLRSLVSMEWRDNDRQLLYGFPLNKVAPSFIPNIVRGIDLCRASGQREIGLSMNPDTEYLFWALANGGRKWEDHLRFTHVYVPNASALLAGESPWPMLVFSHVSPNDYLSERGYRTVWSGDYHSIYIRPL